MILKDWFKTDSLKTKEFNLLAFLLGCKFLNSESLMSEECNSEEAVVDVLDKFLNEKWDKIDSELKGENNNNQSYTKEEVKRLAEESFSLDEIKRLREESFSLDETVKEVKDTDEKTKSLVKELNDLEKDKNGQNTRVSIRPEKNGNNSIQNKYLDTLARLFTGKETCVAVYYDEINSKLLIASNWPEPEYAKKYMERLSNFANSRSEKGYNELIKYAILQIYSKDIEKSDKGKTRKEKKKQDSSLCKFKNRLNGFIKEEKAEDDLLKKLGDNKNLSEIMPLFENLYMEGKGGDNERANNVWNYLLPIEDTNFIVDAICYDENDERRLDGKIIKIIKEGESKDNIVYVNIGKKDVHAEMKIISSKLCDLSSLQETRGYIGIAKLCCVPCKVVIDLFNEKSGGEHKFEVCGTHGGTYKFWLIPNVFLYKEEILEKLEELIKSQKKLPETTADDIPNNLPEQLFRSWSQINSLILTSYSNFEDKEKTKEESSQNESESQESTNSKGKSVENETNNSNRAGNRQVTIGSDKHFEANQSKASSSVSLLNKFQQQQEENISQIEVQEQNSSEQVQSQPQGIIDYTIRVQQTNNWWQKICCCLGKI